MRGASGTLADESRLHGTGPEINGEDGRSVRGGYGCKADRHDNESCLFHNVVDCMYNE